VRAFNEEVVVVRVDPGSSAAAAGVRRGDELLSVDGRIVAADRMSEVWRLLKGAPGSEASLVVRTAGQEPRTVDLVRATSQVSSAAYHVRNGVGVIVLTDFDLDASIDFNEALAQMESELGGPPRAVLLDLRDNLGGLLEEVILVASVFLERGTVVAVKERGAHPVTHSAGRETGLENVPVAVLVNRHTSIGAEILSGALREGASASLVGERTAGAGCIQTLRMLADGGALLMTTGLVLTPSGGVLDGVGLEPDVLVEDTIERSPDLAMETALRLLQP
jgi:carboxyl-terminal processing protease